MRKTIIILAILIGCSVCGGCTSLFPPKVQGGKADMQIERVEKIEPSKTNETFTITIREKK